MDRAHVIALTVLLVLAGCSAATSDDGTVTPAPVPTPDSPTPPPPCEVPTAAPPTDSRTASAPPSPASIPQEKGTVDVGALIERHDRTLRQHSYQLTSPQLTVQAGPATALRVRVRAPTTAVRHYVVDGTRYTYTFRRGGQQRYQVNPHDEAQFRRGFESAYSLTGSDWLADALSLGPHRVDTRLDDGSAVLRAERTPETVDDRGTAAGTERTAAPDGDLALLSLNSAVVVDRRGIVRAVEQRYGVRRADGSTRSVNRSFAVTDVGTATVDRPEWVCVAERNGHLSVP